MNSFAPEKFIHSKQKIETFVFFGSSYDKREFIIIIRYLCINMESLLIAITSKIVIYIFVVRTWRYLKADAYQFLYILLRLIKSSYEKYILWHKENTLFLVYFIYVSTDNIRIKVGSIKT